MTATVHYLPSAGDVDEDQDQDRADDIAALADEIGRLAGQLAEVRAERDQLRELVLDMADHHEVNERWRRTCIRIARERYEAGRRDEAEAAFRRAWGGWPT